MYARYNAAACAHKPHLKAFRQPASYIREFALRHIVARCATVDSEPWQCLRAKDFRVPSHWQEARLPCLFAQIVFGVRRRRSSEESYKRGGDHAPGIDMSRDRQGLGQAPDIGSPNLKSGTRRSDGACACFNAQRRAADSLASPRRHRCGLCVNESGLESSSYGGRVASRDRVGAIGINGVGGCHTLSCISRGSVARRQPRSGTDRSLTWPPPGVHCGCRSASPARQNENIFRLLKCFLHAIRLPSC